MRLVEIKISLVPTSNDPVISVVLNQTYPDETGTVTIHQCYIDQLKDIALQIRQEVGG